MGMLNWKYLVLKGGCIVSFQFQIVSSIVPLVVPVGHEAKKNGYILSSTRQQQEALQ